jgi:hypothetical protein
MWYSGISLQLNHCIHHHNLYVEIYGPEVWETWYKLFGSKLVAIATNWGTFALIWRQIGVRSSVVKQKQTSGTSILCPHFSFPNRILFCYCVPSILIYIKASSRTNDKFVISKMTPGIDGCLRIYTSHKRSTFINISLWWKIRSWLHLVLIIATSQLKYTCPR